MTQLTGQALQDAAEQRQKELAERGLEMSINSIKVSLLLETATAEDHAKHEQQLRHEQFAAVSAQAMKEHREANPELFEQEQKVTSLWDLVEYDDLPTEAEREVYRQWSEEDAATFNAATAGQEVVKVTSPFDITRMEAALASERIQVPPNMTREQLRDFIIAAVKDTK